MNVWKSKNWLKFYDSSNAYRTGLRLRFEKGIDPEIRRSSIEFCKWLRKQYYFPIRVPIYFKVSEYIISKSGEKFSAIFFEPFDRNNEPYIRIATGDFKKTKQKTCQDDALAGILCSISHELTHYYQWINDVSLTEIGEERQASSYANMIVDEYVETREHP